MTLRPVLGVQLWNQNILKLLQVHKEFPNKAFMLTLCERLS